MSGAKKLKYMPLTLGSLGIPGIPNKSLYFNVVIFRFNCVTMRIAEMPRLFGNGNVDCTRQQKGRRNARRPFFNSRAGGSDLATPNHLIAVQSAATRLVSRDNFRDAVFLCSTPRATPRASSGCAAARASAAAVLSPPSSAASTFFTKVRMRDRRLPLIKARASLRRMRLRACGELAMCVLRSAAGRRAQPLR